MLGARVEPTGVRFRVWAPNADRAIVAYDGHWDPAQGFELARAGEYFEGLVPGLQPGTRYKYVFVENGARPIWRIDPAARDTAHSGLEDPGNGAFVVDPHFEWPPFRTPAFQDLIIYQVHVGIYAGLNDHFSGVVGDGVPNIRLIEPKFDYIRGMGFNAIQLLPIQEFHRDRSWGYNPSFYYSVESAYGPPENVRDFVARAHESGLAVLFDVVYNHVANSDNPLWGWDVFPSGGDHGEYLFPPHATDWGPGPAFEKPAVREFFIENALMLFDEYDIDGLRFDATRAIEANGASRGHGWRFLQELTWRVKERFPDKYLIAEHLPDHDTIVRSAGLHATWLAASHHEFQRAAHGDDPVQRIKSFLGKDFGYGRNYPSQWNLVKYCLGSHDDCGDDKGGATLSHPADYLRHRYFVEFYGGRDDWHARAKARVGWALTVTAMGTPMLFSGLECHHWGYWHDTPDSNGDHRFNWAIAGDSTAMPMRRLVATANEMRWSNSCLRGETLDVVHEDYDNNVLAFKRYEPGGHNCLLTVVNMSDRSFADRSYGVATGGQSGQWTQILCTQDSAFGGWDGAGNAFHEPWTQADGRVYINLPQWSVVVLRLQ
jgi:1,4-alpha-glucan branching enzyme